MSHRAIIKKAQMQGLKQILVFEDDVIFLEDTLVHLEKTIAELKKLDWHLFYLGGHKWGHSYKKADGCQYIDFVHASLTCTQAIAYHHSVYQQLLDEIPETAPDVKKWLETRHGIDQYYRYVKKRYLAFPVVASQPNLLPQENPLHKDRFN